MKQHVLLPFARAIAEADAALPAKLPESSLREIVDLVPERWLEGGLAREDYVGYLTGRLRPPRSFAEEAARAHAMHV